MRRTFFVPLLLALSLAACNTTPSVPSTEVKTPPTSESSGNANTGNQRGDPARVAQYLADSGFTKEDAKRVIESLGDMSNADLKFQSLSEQSAFNKTRTDAQRAMDLILNDEVESSELGESSILPQAISRQLAVDASRSISLNSASNFQYYQSINYLRPALDYIDNGCSAPAFFFAANATFYPACDQHDFGYRNGLYAELHNYSFKEAVDIGFLNNMEIICDNRWQGSWADRGACKIEAGNFYKVVSSQGVMSYWILLPSQ